MTDDGVAPGEDHDDSPWRPGADVRFDHPPRAPFADRNGDPVGVDDASPSAGAPTADVPPGRPFGVPPRRGLAAALLLTVAIGAATVAVLGGATAPSGDLDEAAVRPDDASTAVRQSALRDLGGDVTLGPGDVPLLTATACPANRLPSSVDVLWDVELSTARRVITPVTISEESVVAVVGFDELTANGLPAVAVLALDIDDGQERWRAGLEPATGSHEIIGVVDGAVIVRSAAGPDMAYRRLFAFDEDTGDVLWDRGFRGDWSATVDATTGLVYVGVRRPAVSSMDDSEVEVLDPRTGDRLHIAGGALVGLDPDGRLVTRIGDKVLATSNQDRDLLGVLVPGDSSFTLVGDRLVGADGAVSDLSVSSGEAEARRFPLVGSTGLDAPGFVVSLDPLGESSLIVNGDGAVHGAQVGADSVEIRWRVQGVALESVATDRGRSLLIATEGGAHTRVIDSSTGRTITHVELRPGAFATLTLAANGVVVQDVIDGAPARVAVDLDGRELWSLPGRGPLAIGRGVVVDVDDADAVVRVTAWGDPIESRTDVVECGSVMTDWIPR